MPMTSKFDLLVAMKAMEKEVSKRVKELEDEVKSEFMDSYRASGVDRMRSTVFDPKAAWLTLKGGKPSERVERFQLNDPDAAMDWMDDNSPDTYKFAIANIEEFCKWWFYSTGECPDGCAVIAYDSEPVEPTPCLTVKEAKVLPALKDNPGLLNEASVLMLGSGE